MRAPLAQTRQSHETLIMVRHLIRNFPRKVFLELLVEPKRICLKSYTESQGPAGNLFADGDHIEVDTSPPIGPGQLPKPTPGKWFKYHVKADFLNVPEVPGEEFHPDLKGKSLRLRSYSQLDLQDPSLVRSQEGSAQWIFCIAKGLRLTAPYNGLENSKHQHPLSESRQMGSLPILIVHQLIPKSSLLSCPMTARCSELGFASNVEEWIPADESRLIADLVGFQPQIQVLEGGGSILADGWQKIRLSVLDHEGTPLPDGELHLESTGGYLPLRKVGIQNGITEFKVSALGLSAGQSFKLQAGFANLSHLAVVEFNVT